MEKGNKEEFIETNRNQLLQEYDMTLFDDLLISNIQCPPGFVDKGGNCQIIDRSNPVRNCNEYCGINSISCSIFNYQGICKCKPDFYGLTCEIAKANLKFTIENYKDELSQSITSPFSIDDLSKIFTLQYLLKTNPELANDLVINSSDITTRLTSASQIYDKAMSQFIDAIFTILKLQLKRVINPRNEDNIIVSNGIIEDNISMINEISESFHRYMMESSDYDFTKDKNCFIETNVDFFCSSFTQSSTTYNEYKNLATKNKRGFIDLTNAASNQQYIVIQREISEELNTLITNDASSSSRIEYFISTILPVTTSIIYKLPMPLSLNSEHISYWAAHDIDVFDSQTPAFVDPCYVNHRSKFDLVPLYRATLYQNKTIEISNRKCKYSGLESMFNYIIFKCPPDEPSLSFTLLTARLSTISLRLHNIPTYCVTIVKNIHNNIAFWLFLMMTIVFLTLSIVITSLRHCRVIRMQQMITYENIFELQIRDDEVPIINNNNNNKPRDNKSNDASRVDTPTRGGDMSNSLNYRSNQNYDYQNYQIQDSFCKILCRNMLKLHPMTCLCQENVLNPFLMKFSLFTFNLFCQYGFLAIYYFDYLIDDMRTRKDRFNFIYAVKYDFEKIIYAILTSIAFNLLLKGIILIPIDKKNKLNQRLENANDEESKYEIT